MDEMKLLEAYARLSAFKDNLPDIYSIGENYVHEYHSILDLLKETSNLDPSGFRVPDSEVQKRITSSSMEGNTYSDIRYCDRAFLTMKVDAILRFFAYQMPDSSKKKIGFIKD